jgi:hypothetical protein
MPIEEPGEVTLTAREKASVFLPLGIYLIYLLYLIFFSVNPFLIRWLEGCFALFVALVFCNLLRKGLVDRAEESQEGNGEDLQGDSSSPR